MAASDFLLAGAEPRARTNPRSLAPRVATRSDRDFDDSPPDDDDGDQPADEWDDCDSWPPDDLDLELDDEPEPEPGDFWLPQDDEE